MTLRIDSDTGTDETAIERLLDSVFGPDRHRRTAYRFRDGVPPVAGLGFVAHEGSRLTGTIRFWPVRIAPADAGLSPLPALLLGPLGVDPALRGRGIGTALLRRGLAEARAQGHRRIFLIGDEPYYGRVGFQSVLPARCSLPGPVDPARVLVWTATAQAGLPEAFALEPVHVSSPAAR